MGHEFARRVEAVGSDVTSFEIGDRVFGFIGFSGPFGAHAEYVTITEDGWVGNPIFRFVSRYVMGHHATMDGMLKDVAKKFGEQPELTGT